MAGLDLDVLGVGVQARPPVDDAVAARVDRDVAHAVRERLVERLAELLAALAVPAVAREQAGHAQRAERAHRAHLQEDQRVHRQRI